MTSNIQEQSKYIVSNNIFSFAIKPLEGGDCYFISKPTIFSICYNKSYKNIASSGNITTDSDNFSHIYKLYLSGDYDKIWQFMVHLADIQGCISI